MAIGKFQKPGAGQNFAGGKRKVAKPARQASKPKAAKRRSSRKKRT